MVEQLADSDLVEEVPQQELRRGSRLGRYELLLPIAKGGMARVWAARLHGQRGFSKTVAIKTILPHLAEEPEFERMFLDEARIAAGVHHPNVCEIYELGEEGKILYLAMEWVNGESFVHILRSSPNAPSAGPPPAGAKIEPMHPHLAARIVADAAAGLNAAHNLTDEDGQPLNVVHRDVSPHNILISAEGNVKVADFGVAKALGQMTNTAAGQIKGKMAYMAPEQVEGRAIDRRSDVFSLGVVLYEATTGRKPFTGEGDAQVMHAILMGQYTPPSRLVRGYPRELEEIIARAMAPNPAQRFPTAERMHLALEEFIAKSGSIVTPSHVASFVQQRVGAQLDRRREKIRAASTTPAAEDISSSGAQGAAVGSASGVKPHGAAPRFDATPAPQAYAPGSSSGVSSPSAVSSPSGVSASAVAPTPAPTADPSSPMKYVLAASIGVGVACLIAVGGLIAIRKMNADAPPAAPTSTTSAVASAPVAKPSAAPSASPAAAPVALTPVVFNVTPASAVLVVDGHALDASVRQVERKKGSASLVTVQAPGYVDEVVNVDETTADKLDITLTSAAPTATATGSSSATSGKSGRPPALPSNPYGP